MSDPRVSIVIPCYNVAAHIDDVLTSALGQTYQPIEIICVDNGSTDQTLDYLRNYVERGEITLLHQSIKGAPAARNLGWRAAKGDWIQFLDADDIILPHKIARQVALLQSNVDAPFIASAYQKFDLASGQFKRFPLAEDPWMGLLSNGLGITSANLFQRSLLEKVGGWDETKKSSQEYDLMFRIMQLDDGLIMDQLAEETVVQHRSSDSISAVDTRGNKQRLLALISRVVSYLKEEKPAVYAQLDASWFQEMFLRIHLNSVDGQSGSPRFYKAILPVGFEAQAHPYLSEKYRKMIRVIGYPSACRIQRLFRRVL